jgi:uncharacterized pyridoxamine 5'-phosphate oxidase family protein
MPDGESPHERAQQVLANAETCTLATVSPDGRPEAATVRFVADDTLDVYITTESTYRKYHNMTQNPSVALVVDGRYNLQLEGTASEIHDRTVDWFKRQYTETYGQSEYLTDDDSVFFRVTTDWARLLVDGSFPPAFEMVIGDGEADPHGST